MSNETKEDVYDREIAPLMSQIIEICGRAGIAIIADFELDPRNGDAEDPLFCTTVIVPPTACTRMRMAAALLKPGAMRFAVGVCEEPEGMRS